MNFTCKISKYELDEYKFEGLFGNFTSKVHFEKGYYWTNKQPQYKAQSLKYVKITSLND